MTDDAGELVSFKYYEPYGNVLVDEVIGTPSDNRFDYTNKERDEETGLSYFEARYLSTDTGRFLSLDPWEGDYYDPQSLNKYAYARNNPITYNDPTGKWFQAVVAAIWVAAETVGAAMDVTNAVQTMASPTSTPTEVITSIGFAAMSIGLPGGGYSKIDDVAKLVNKADDVGSATIQLKNGQKIGEAGGSGAGKPFSDSRKNATRQESNNKCVFLRSSNAGWYSGPNPVKY